MDWHDIEQDGRVLKRIVATLFALAWLADYAAALPGPVRWVGLWFLRRAESVVREFVLGDVPDWQDLWESEDASDELTRLAASFRMLARILGHVIAHARRRSPPGLHALARLAGLGDLLAAPHPFGRATPPDTP